MVTALLIALGLLAQTQPAPPLPSPPPDVELEKVTTLRLLEVRRVYVDRLTGGETAAQIRDMIIASLQNAKLFILTENPDKADAFLRGSAEDLIFTNTYSSSESLSARASSSVGSNPDRTASDRRSRYAGVSVGEQDSVRIAERKHEASASVRLVSREGDVLWSTTQESMGAKFRGASADVADKVTRQLQRDLEIARQLKKSLDSNRLQTH
ncbi:MAG: hypothetical protein ACUVXB_06480 [Bryobacteraceae bacterium]